MTSRMLKTAALLALCSGAIPLLATPCTIGNGCLSDRIWIMDPAGIQVYGKSVQESHEVANAIYAIRVPGLTDTTMYGKPDVLLEEPDFTSVSDVVGVVFLGGQFYLGFKSDSDTGMPAVTFGTGHPTFLDETNARLDITQFLAPALRDQGYTAFFRSSTVEPPQVPEPATVGLLGGGLILLAALRKRARP